MVNQPRSRSRDLAGQVPLNRERPHISILKRREASILVSHKATLAKSLRAKFRLD